MDKNIKLYIFKGDSQQSLGSNKSDRKYARFVCFRPHLWLPGLHFNCLWEYSLGQCKLCSFFLSFFLSFLSFFLSFIFSYSGTSLFSFFLFSFFFLPSFLFFFFFSFLFFLSFFFWVGWGKGLGGNSFLRKSLLLLFCVSVCVCVLFCFVFCK